MHRFRLSVLAGVALIALSAAASAAPKKPAAAPPPPDPRIGLLEQQLRDIQQQLAQIKGAQEQNDTSGAVADLKRSSSSQYVDLNNRLDAQNKTAIDNGRLTVSSPNGAFSLSLRSLVQFDVGYFAQGKNPSSVDLNSGTNFRRAQLGFQGVVFKDWAYNFLYDFGGNGVEGRGYIYNAYIQYDGLKPFGFRIGAYTPSEGIEDQTGSGDLFFAERAGWGSDSPDPIFIVGLPRSGSTLIEQILASHSSVEGAGELPDLPLTLVEESKRRGQLFPQWVGAMRPDDWQRLGRRYLERTSHWSAQRPVFTDKLPNNWQYIGVIRAMLPGARIIGVRRDPLETCFSCYRQFLYNNEYQRTFADLAAFWRDFDRSLKHALAQHAAHVHESVYEDLLADPERHIRVLLDFCGLAFEPACLEFHRTERDVRSPSAMQVREPLRRDTARAARYGVLLDPLRAELARYNTSQPNPPENS